MSGASFPVGRYTLLVNHHGISQPSPASWRLASSSQDLSGPCCSHHRVVHDAETQRLMGYLYTPRYCYISPLCFTAQRSQEVRDRTRRRTPGGVFFQFVRARATKQERRRLFPP